MKKNIYIIFSICFIIFTACDYNKRNFEGLDEIVKPKYHLELEYEFLPSDYVAMKEIVKKSPDATAEQKAMAESVSKFNSFSTSQPADQLIPFFLASKYFSVDNGSSARITYFWYENKTTVLRQDQFLYNDGVWTFDPTVYRKMTKDDYTFLINWVQQNKGDQFLDTYKTADLWFGASSYKNYFDLRPDFRMANDPGNLLTNTDEATRDQVLNEQVQAGINQFLEWAYPTAEPQNGGIDVFYYITYDVCRETGKVITYEVKYKGLSPGKFIRTEDPKQN